MLTNYGISIKFYKTGSGQCPVREFLDDLKESDLGDFAAVIAGLTKLRGSLLYMGFEANQKRFP